MAVGYTRPMGPKSNGPLAHSLDQGQVHAAKSPVNPWVRLTLLVMPGLAAMGSFVSMSPGSSGTANGYRIVTALALVPALLMFSRSRAGSTSTRLLVVTTLAFAFWGTFALTWTPSPGVGKRQLLGILLAILGTWVAIGLTSRQAAAVRSLRSGFVLAAFALTAIGLWQFATGNNLWRLAGQPFRFRDNMLIGTFVNPNNFAAFLLGCSGPVLSWALYAKGIRKPLGLLLLASMAFVILGTTSRAGILGLLIIVGWVLIIVMGQVPRLQVPIVFTVAVLSLVTWGIFGRQLSVGITTAFAGDTAQSDNLRIGLSQTAIRYFAESQGIGIGPAGFQERLSAESAQDVLATHNTFLQMAAEYGVPVILPFAALMTVLMVRALRTRTRTATGVDPARIELIAGVIAIMIGALVASSLIADPSWWLLIGYLIVLTRQQTDASTSESEATSSGALQN